MTPEEVLASFHHHKILWEICIYGGLTFLVCAAWRNPLLFFLVAFGIVYAAVMI